MSEEPYIYRASDLGSCSRVLMARRLGMEPIAYPDNLLRIFRQGNIFEEIWVRMMGEDGFDISRQQEEVNLQISGGVVIQGHIDGVIESFPGMEFPGPYLLEIKSMGDGPYKQFTKHRMDCKGLIQKYKWQLSCYMYGTNLPAVIVAINRGSGDFVYEEVRMPPYSVADIRKRVLDIELRVGGDGDMPKCEEITYPCPFVYLHDGGVVEEGTEDDEKGLVIEEDDPLLDQLSEEYQVLVRSKKDAEEEASEARERLLNALKGRNARKVVTENYTISKVVKLGRVGVDVEKMKADGVYGDYEVRGDGWEELRVAKKKVKVETV